MTEGPRSAQPETPRTLLRERWHSTIEQHTIRSGRLEPPFLQIPAVELLDSARDLLPELLWLDAVVRSYSDPRSVALRHIDAVLEAFDTVKPEGKGILGMASELALPPEEQTRVLAALSAEQRALSFPSPFREAMAMYSEFPGRFITEGLEMTAKKEDAINWVRESVMRLIDRHSATGAYVNTLLVRGLFRAGRISIPGEGTDDLITALSIYPMGTEDQTAHVEGFARSAINAMSPTLVPADHAWSMHFWRTNGKLVECRPSA